MSCAWQRTVQLSVVVFFEHIASTYLVLSPGGLEEGLVCSTTTCNDTNHTTAGAGEHLLGTRGELDTGLALVGVVADDGHVVARGTAERTTVSGLLLDVGEDGTLGDGVEREDVADGESGVLSGVDELCVLLAWLLPPRLFFAPTNLASVHALVGDEGLRVVLEPVRLKLL